MAIVGAFCLSVIVAYAVFLACFRLLDHLRLWSDAGLAALIPMLAVSIPTGILAGGITMWGLS